MRSDSDLHEPRTNVEQSETGDDLRVSYESDEDFQVVYFIGAMNGLVKIGFASNFEARLSQIVCGSPVHLHPLAITLGGRFEERQYHDRFKPWRSHGEWFYLTDTLEEEIDRINHSQTQNYIPHRFRGFVQPLTLTIRSEP